MQCSESPHTHTHTHTHQSYCLCWHIWHCWKWLSEIDTLFFFSSSSNIHDVMDAKLHRVFFLVSLFLYKSGQWKYELSRRMTNVGHVIRSRAWLHRTNMMNGWEVSSKTLLTHTHTRTHTHTHTNTNTHKQCCCTTETHITGPRRYYSCFFCYPHVLIEFFFFLFTLSGAQREVGEKAKDIKGPLKKRNA